MVALALALWIPLSGAVPLLLSQVTSAAGMSCCPRKAQHCCKRHSDEGGPAFAGTLRCSNLCGAMAFSSPAGPSVMVAQLEAPLPVVAGVAMRATRPSALRSAYDSSLHQRPPPAANRSLTVAAR